jgi:hypothetical protein
VVEFAEATLDLSSIATGPRDELGLGHGFEQHSCVDLILQELRRFPGRGARLIQAGLRSPVVRNRNLAVAALAAWPREQWPRELARSMEQAAACEPDEGMRERMQKVLKGDSLSS